MKKSLVLEQYQKNAIITSFPLELMILLLKKAKREVQLGKYAIECRNISDRNKHLQTAQLIINEMSLLLNPISSSYSDYINLLKHFNYMLLQANVLNETNYILELEKYLNILLVDWEWVLTKNKSSINKITQF